MPFLSIVFIALSLSMDAFAASITCGLSIRKRRLHSALLTGGLFGLFQALMPALGWLIGRWASRWIGAFDYWIAFGLLLFVGGHMILQAVQPDDPDADDGKPLSLKTLLMLAVATSIDAFAVGITLSLLGVSILQPVLVIGAVTFLVSMAGFGIGCKTGTFNQAKMEIAGGVVLVGLGVKILVENLVAQEVLFMETQHVWFALALTLAAGLATGIGSLMALFGKRSGARRFSFFTGLSTGLLLWIAFRELLPTSSQTLLPLVGFFPAILITALVDHLVPPFGNPHEPTRIEALSAEPAGRRTGMPAALAIGLHSFPEGLAVFVAVLHTPRPVALGAALALALHNIPEGISAALPLYHATGSRAKACFFSALTGLAEPLAALLAYTLLHRFLNDPPTVLLTAGSAGILVFIALDGLLPAARLFGKAHHALAGIVVGLLAAALLSLL